MIAENIYLKIQSVELADKGCAVSLSDIVNHGELPVQVWATARFTVRAADIPALLLDPITLTTDRAEEVS